jgi:AbrB family looped-hinge helix DNA binding protein
MSSLRSKLTAQGQISIPAEIRRELGIGPGSVVEWELVDGKAIMQRVRRYTSEEIHKILFPDGPPPRRSLKELKQGIETYIRERHARGRY